ncbi:hypothetical protein AURDEDRAFT_164434 [Auricularia subglabra TFB-10046 SS5]|nr:hypothetical protein AURDEDRAFT_164434 [Auricularia subglabra TFB-10046 SS5]
MRILRCAALIAPLALGQLCVAHIPEMSPDVVDWWGVAARVGALAVAAGVVHRWQLPRHPSIEPHRMATRNAQHMPDWLHPRPLNASEAPIVFPKSL